MKRGLILLALSACTPAPYALDLPAHDQARAILLLLDVNTEDPHLYAIDPAAPGALPVISKVEKTDLVGGSALYYTSTLSELELKPGEVALVTDPTSPSRALPHAAAIEMVQLVGASKAAEWISATEPSDAVKAVRIAAGCPTSIPATSALISPHNCFLPKMDRSAICWGAPSRFDSLDQPNAASAYDRVGSVVIERGASWVYFVTSRFTIDPVPYTRPARALLRTSTAIEGLVELLPVLPPPQSHPPGYSASPSVRSDGLEMFFASSWPGLSYCNQQLYVSSRARLEDPWGLVQPLARLNGDGPPPNCTGDKLHQHKAPVLLPDARTLLYWDDISLNVLAARRTSTIAGDLSFVPIEFAGFDNRLRSTYLDSLRLSCDRQHIIYADYHARDGDAGGPVVTQARIVEIVRLEPLQLGHSAVLPMTTVSSTTDLDLWVAEAPDCRTLYASISHAAYTEPRAPCP